MRVVLFLTVLAVAAATYTDKGGIGNDLINGLSGTKNPPPLTNKGIHGWYEQDGGKCHEGLGILYSRNEDGASKDHPVSVYYTKGGQIAGVQATIWGVGSGLFQGDIGDAAQPFLVKQGFWRKAGSEKWTISVSLRAADVMCSGKKADEEVGDRIVVNQDTVAWSVPLTASDATTAGYQPGACLPKMGQHFLFDLIDHPQMSWEAGNLLPIIPMYYVGGAKDGHIHAFFLTTPVLQEGSTLSGDKGWDRIPIPDKAMCINWCNKNCGFNTGMWSTMHWFLDSSFESYKCPDASLILGKSCPDGTIGRDGNVYASEEEADAADVSTPRHSSDIAIVAVAVGLAAFVAALVAYNLGQRRRNSF